MLTFTNVTISGYKSIEHASIDLRPLNVLIGANGSGKSNLLSFFGFLYNLCEEHLSAFVNESGGAAALLFQGPKVTESLKASLTFGVSELEGNDYSIELCRTSDDAFVVKEERFEREMPLLPGEGPPSLTVFGPGQSLVEGKVRDAMYLRALLHDCREFHFNDTSREAKVRRRAYIGDRELLHHDSRNLASVLNRLRRSQPDCYHRIVNTIRQIAPWFDDFVLAPVLGDLPNILLNWRDRYSDQVYGPHQLSDGTLRAMGLATLLLQPVDRLPKLILIDEPELGLHPQAIVVLAELIKQASHHCQVIVATQSSGLLDQFGAEDVIVVDREGPASTFRRLEPEKLDEWLEEYTLSELWEKNVIGGGRG